MKGYKGFNKDFSCTADGNTVKYKVGETVEHDGDIKLCKNGLHFCENPLDIFRYYPPTKSKYAEVDADGVSDEKGDDSKRVCKKLTIKAELDLLSLIGAAVNFVFQKVDWKAESQYKKDGNAASQGNYSNAASQGSSSNAASQGYASNAASQGSRSNAASQGYASNAASQGISSNAASQGDDSNAASQGYASNAASKGKRTISASFGVESKAMAEIGSWLVLDEWKQDDQGDWHRNTVKTVRVDGKKIKSDVFYTLKNGKFVEVK